MTMSPSKQAHRIVQNFIYYVEAETDILRDATFELTPAQLLNRIQGLIQNLDATFADALQKIGDLKAEAAAENDMARFDDLADYSEKLFEENMEALKYLQGMRIVAQGFARQAHEAEMAK